MIQVPGTAELKDTVPLVILHPEVEEASIVKVTPRVDVAVAVGV
jgi:hypothetical protein